MIMPMNRITTYACSQCRWCRVVHGNQCLMQPGVNCFDLCPDCGCTQLQITRKDGLGSTVFGELGRVVDRLLNRAKAPTLDDLVNYQRQKAGQGEGQPPASH